jgi:hypothetical protein
LRSVAPTSRTIAGFLGKFMSQEWRQMSSRRFFESRYRVFGLALTLESKGLFK